MADTLEAVTDEFGVKRICQACGTKYYDLTKRPVVCPSCGAEFDPEAVLSSRRGRPVDAKPAKAAEEKPKEEAEDADDVDVEDLPEVEDEDENSEFASNDDATLLVEDDEDEDGALPVATVPTDDEKPDE